MTSTPSAFPGIFFLAIVLMTMTVAIQPAAADDATEIRNHNNRGNMLLSRRLFQEAVKEYETVLQIDPSHAIAKGNLALAHNEWGIWFYRYKKYREAKEQWEIALKINPNDANVKRNLTLPNLRLAEPANAPDAPPKPTGPQDWSPYDDSLDKPQVKHPISNAAATPESNPTVAPGNSSGSEPKANATPAAEAGGSPSGASLVTTSATQVGGITSGASIIGSGGKPYSPSGSTGETSTAGSINTSSSENSSATSGAVILPGTSSNSTAASGAVILPSTSSTTTSETWSSDAAPVSKKTSKDPFEPGPSDPPSSEASTNSVRIIGGSTGSASIIIGGAPSSSTPTAPSYGTTVYGGSGTANVFPSPGAPKAPVNTDAGGTAPVRFAPRQPAGTVPMSWPGGGEATSKVSTTGSQVSEQPKSNPSFLPKPEANVSSEEDEKNDDSSSTVDDVLAKIENKVYGKVSKGMPILKRIERLEVDTVGKKKSGSIADRLKELKETYGF